MLPSRDVPSRSEPGDAFRRLGDVPRAGRRARAGAVPAAAKPAGPDDRPTRRLRRAPAGRRRPRLALSRPHRRAATAHWTIADLNSRWGTTVNGVRLTPDAGAAARGRPGPPRRRTRSSSPHAARRGMQTTAVRDAGRRWSARSAAGPSGRHSGVADRMLQLLLAGAEQVHGATDEKSLAERLIDAALRGSGLTNAAFLRRRRAAAGGSRSSPRGSPTTTAPVEFSQSLIQPPRRASRPSSRRRASDVSQSIVQMNIANALCVPLVIGRGDMTATASRTRRSPRISISTRAACSRRSSGRRRAEFCVALGRIASLSLANLKRLDIERRQRAARKRNCKARREDAGVDAAPSATRTLGPLTCIGESRASARRSAATSST